VLAQGSTSVFQLGVPYLLPQLRAALGGSLSSAAVLVACPSIGLMLTLILWGAVADRYGERLTMTVGLLASGAILAVTGFASGVVPLGAGLVLAGAAGASVNAASGRAVLGWFGVRERGLAMGVRQTALPIGTGVAALILPPAATAWGYQGALWLPAGICFAVGVFVLVVVRDPARPPAGTEARTPSPYRRPELWRVHFASFLLVVPQFAVASFAFLFLTDARHWSSGSAGVLLAASQAAGAAMRLVAGRWSDRVTDRLGPMRSLAVVNAAVVGLLALAAASRLSPAVLVAAAVITVSGNGLAFTATAELAGRQWSGRAMGTQNTVQNVAAAVTPPALGVLITAAGYGPGFGVAALFALAASAVVPRTAGRLTWGLYQVGPPDPAPVEQPVPG